MSSKAPASAVSLYRRVLRSIRAFDDPGKKWYVCRRVAALASSHAHTHPHTPTHPPPPPPPLQPTKNRYYKNWSRNNIASFDDEDDPERLEQLLQKGEEHRKWILKKYKLADPLEGKDP